MKTHHYLNRHNHRIMRIRHARTVRILAAMCFTGLHTGQSASANEALSTWQSESYADVCCPQFPPANWTVSADDLSVIQDANGSASIFYSNTDLTEGTFRATIRVSSVAGDDDSFGVVIGFQPGSTTSRTGDYLIIDWKRSAQSFDFTGDPLSDLTPGGTLNDGLAISMVTGTPSNDELGQHANYPENPSGGLTELARARNLGSQGWLFNTDYVFEIEFDATSIRLFVNGTLEIDLETSVSPGRPGLYNFSQQFVTYSQVNLISPDVIAPSISILAPSGTYGLTQAEVIDVQVTDAESGVQSSSIAIGNRTVMNGERVEMAAFGLGTHVVTATASDIAGNISVAESMFSVVDDVPPNIEILSPEARPYDPAVTPNVEVRVVAEDLESEVVDVRFTLDGAIFTGDNIDLALINAGMHVFTAEAIDVAGNTASATVAFVVDSMLNDQEPPAVQIIRPANDSAFLVTDSSFEIEVTATDDTMVASIEFTLDGIAWPADRRIVPSELGVGSHTLIATVEDVVGKTSTDQAVFSIQDADGSESADGCGCSTSGTEVMGPWLWLLLLGAYIARPTRRNNAVAKDI